KPSTRGSLLMLFPSTASDADPGAAANLVALGLAAVASFVLLVMPVVTIEQRSVMLDGAGKAPLVRSSVSAVTLLEENGRSVLVVLALPVGAAVVPFSFRGARRRRSARRAIAVLLGILCAVAVMSIGLFYLPAAAAMWIASRRTDVE
ncbi:MAG: hypothetical protein ACREQY_15420, partial [Candidatus Binatia bacterium]